MVAEYESTRRFWSGYWANDTAERQVGTYLTHNATDNAPGVQVGDIAYAVTISKGELFILGRMEIGEVTDLAEAKRRVGNDVWEANNHFFARPGTDMRISFDHPVPLDVAQQIRVIRSDGINPLKFAKPGELDRQALRGFVELTAESAKIFEGLIANELLGSDLEIIDQDSEALEISEAQENGSTVDSEGRSRTFLGHRYERKRSLRNKAILHHGPQCLVCGFSFGEMYGEHGKGFAEVHHIVPLASCEGEHDVDYTTDLVVLCANCHRMIHRNPLQPLSIQELETIVNAYYDEILDEAVESSA
jgi:hypothetical protein